MILVVEPGISVPALSRIKCQPKQAVQKHLCQEAGQTDEESIGLWPTGTGDDLHGCPPPSSEQPIPTCRKSRMPALMNKELLAELK